MRTTSSNAEDRVAAGALGKTVAFLLYSVLSSVVVAAVLLLTTPLKRATEAAQDLVVLTVITLVEVLLLYLVIRGYLPGTRGSHARPFSEAQLAAGCALLSILTVVWPFDVISGIVVEVGTNCLLVLGVLVYFLVKSVVGRRPRWRVLGVLVLPAVVLLMSLAGGAA